VGTNRGSRSFLEKGLAGGLLGLSSERSKPQTLAALVGALACGAAFFLGLVVLHNPGVAMAIYILALGVVILLFEPYVGLLNYIIFIYVRPQEFLEAFRGLPVITIVGGATFAITILYFAFRKRWILRSPQDSIVMWLYGAMILSHMANMYAGGALDTANFFANRIVLYLLLAGLIVTERKLKTVLYLIVVLTLFQAGQGIMQHFTGVGIAGQSTIEEGRIRGIGIFADPNNLAMTFMMSLPFVVLKTLASRSIFFKVTGVLIIGVLIWGLVLTDSRGGFLALGVVTMVMFSRRYGRKAGIIVGVLLFAFLFAAGPSRFQEFDTREDSAEGRVEAWAAGMDMFQSHPLFGVGARAFDEHHFRAAHSSFVQCAAEVGLFGLFPWVLLIVLSLRGTNYVSRHAKSPALRLEADAVFNGLIAFLVSAMFISRAYNDLFFLMMGISTAVGSVYIQSSETKIRILERKDLITTLIISIGMLLVVKAYVMTYWG